MRNQMARTKSYTSAIARIAVFLSFVAASSYLTAQPNYSITDVARVNDHNDETPGATAVNNAGRWSGKRFCPGLIASSCDHWLA
jgi:hypothetical protein